MIQLEYFKFEYDENHENSYIYPHELEWGCGGLPGERKPQATGRPGPARPNLVLSYLPVEQRRRRQMLRQIIWNHDLLVRFTSLQCAEQGSSPYTVNRHFVLFWCR
jgi:hypothetical protein